MNILISLLLLSPALSLATNEPDIEAYSECRSHMSDANCEEKEDIVKVRAITEVKNQFNVLETRKIAEATLICNQSLEAVRVACNLSEFTSRQNEINQIANSYGEEAQRGNSIQRSAADLNAESTRNSIQQIISRLEQIQNRLTEKSNELEDLKNVCEEKRAESNNLCVRPVVTTDEVRPVEKTEGNAIGAAQLGSNVTLRVGSVGPQSRDMDLVDDTQRQATVLYRPVADTANSTLDFADSSSRQIEAAISSLRGRFSPDPQPCDTSGLVSTCNEPEPGPTPPNPEPEPGPTPRHEERQVVNNTEKRNRNEGGLSAEEAGDQANSRVYGSVSTSEGEVSATPTANQSSRSGGIGGALSGLGSILGKASGAFGVDGYSSSTNSRFASNGSGNSGRNKSNYDSNSDSMNNSFGTRRNYANPSSKTNAPAGSKSRAFSSVLSNNSRPMSNSQSGASGSGLMSGGSDGSSSSTPQEKPGLLSRLFGKKKDKTIFGKRDSPGLARSFNQNSSNRPGLKSQKSDSNSSDESLTRVFDASKYTPSKKANEKAYARATGRKLASHSLIRKKLKWPNDISRNKQSNIFHKIQIAHQIEIHK